MVKAKSFELFSKVEDAYCRLRGDRFVFLLNGVESKMREDLSKSFKMF